MQYNMYGKIAFLTIDIDDKESLNHASDLLDLLDRLGVKATFFIVARVAEENPRVVREIVERGHEVGSHGYIHERLDKMDLNGIEDSVVRSVRVLSKFSDVKSFRAPYMRLPKDALRILARHGITVDSSVRGFNRATHPYVDGDLIRLPVTYSTWILKLPWRIQKVFHHTPPRIVVFKITPGIGGGIRDSGYTDPLPRLILSYVARGYKFGTTASIQDLVSKVPII